MTKKYKRINIIGWYWMNFTDWFLLFDNWRGKVSISLRGCCDSTEGTETDEQLWCPTCGTSCSSRAAEVTLMVFGLLNWSLTASQQIVGRSHPLCCFCFQIGCHFSRFQCSSFSCPVAERRLHRRLLWSPLHGWLIYKCWRYLHRYCFQLQVTNRTAASCSRLDKGFLDSVRRVFWKDRFQPPWCSNQQ